MMQGQILLIIVESNQLLMQFVPNAHNLMTYYYLVKIVSTNHILYPLYVRFAWVFHKDIILLQVHRPSRKIGHEVILLNDMSQTLFIMMNTANTIS